jgi:hypothetical protein
VLLGLKQFCGVLHFLEFAFFFGKLFAQCHAFLLLLVDLLHNDLDRRFFDPGFSLSCA